MIRGAVLHLMNEQPLLVDLEALPGAGDSCVRCTNVRLTSGRRPPWVTRGDTWFMFPLVHVRFLEVPAESAADVVAGATSALVPADAHREPVTEAELELDADLLRRIRES